jgi:N-acetylneuraminic acid mutarotase
MWKVVGKLPRPLGYGVSVTQRNTLVCVGGSDAKQHYADAFRLSWQDGRLSTIPLPALPVPIANGCGALLGDMLYVAGGQERPDATLALRSVYRLDLSADKPRWETVEECPGSGRILATAAACDASFWLVGGAELVVGKDGKTARRYLRDAYRYHRGGGWQRISNLPRAAVAAPSPALCDAMGIYIFGGDDGRQQGLKSPEQHRGFSRQVLRYDVKTDGWHEACNLPAAHVTAPCVLWNQRAIIASGEVRPGVRSPEVWSVNWPPPSKNR